MGLTKPSAMVQLSAKVTQDKASIQLFNAIINLWFKETGGHSVQANMHCTLSQKPILFLSHLKQYMHEKDLNTAC
jgi:hypothetical protein